MLDNTTLFLLINSYAGKSATLDFIGVVLGEYMPFLFIAVEVYLYFFAKRKIEALLAFYSVLIALLLNQIIALFYFHNRPFMDGIGIVLKPHIAESSFPSDHTTFMFAIIWSLLLYKNSRKYAYILFPLGIIGGFSRVFMGIHYPYDIVGGIVSGFIGALIIYGFKIKLTWLNNLIFKIENKIFKGKL